MIRSGDADVGLVRDPIEPAEGIAILRDIEAADREHTDAEDVLKTWLMLRVEP